MKPWHLQIGLGGGGGGGGGKGPLLRLFAKTEHYPDKQAELKRYGILLLVVYFNAICLCSQLNFLDRLDLSCRCLYIHAPALIDRGYKVFILSVCISVCCLRLYSFCPILLSTCLLSVCLCVSLFVCKTFNVGHNFEW